MLIHNLVHSNCGKPQLFKESFQTLFIHLIDPERAAARCVRG